MKCCVVSKASLPPAGSLEAVARQFSPRVMPCSRTAVMFDAGGLGRTVGPPAVIVEEVRRVAADEGLVVRAAMAGTMSAAWLLAHASTAATVIESGREAAVLAREHHPRARHHGGICKPGGGIRRRRDPQPVSHVPERGGVLQG